MSQIPGHDPPQVENRPHGVFGIFSPIPINRGEMHFDKKFDFTSIDKKKGNISFLKCWDVANSRECSFIKYEDIEDDEYDDEFTDILHEINIISDLDHENILKFYEVVRGTAVNDVGFLFEPHASLLSDVLAEKIENVSKPAVIKTIMRDIFTALQYLHKHRIIHRDIQPENIAISSTGVLKVWNFRNAFRSGRRPNNLKVNEFRYQCIELLMECGNYDETVDVWSANCIFAQLWLKKPLFPNNGPELVSGAMCRLLGFPTQEIWEEFFTIPHVEDLQVLNKYKYNMLNTLFEKNCTQEVSPLAMNLMHKCFRYNPKYRLKAELCLRHEYFSEEPKACPREQIVTLLENLPRVVHNIK